MQLDIECTHACTIVLPYCTRKSSESMRSLLELRFVIEKDRDVIGAHKGDTNVTAVFSINVVTSCKSITRKKT